MPPLRLAILECGAPPPQFQTTPATTTTTTTSSSSSSSSSSSTSDHSSGYGPLFTSLFARALAPQPLDSVLAVTIHDAVTLPPDAYPPLAHLDALLLTGSKHDAFADDPWILTLLAYLHRALVSAPHAIRIVGVCFGHQLLARALGAPVGRSAAGWEVGVMDVALTEEGRAVFREDGAGARPDNNNDNNDNTLRIHQMHQDAVHALPPGAALLAASPACRVQAFLVPGRALAVQGHPEFTEPVARAVLETRRAAGVHSEALYREGMERAGLPHDGERVARAFVRFVREGAHPR